MCQGSINRGNTDRSSGRSRQTAAKDIDASDARFDLPPQFGGRDDRRMASRAEAMWASVDVAGRPCGHGGHDNAALPGHRSIETGASSEFAAHAVLLDLCRSDRVGILWSGAEVRGAFGVRPGPLASDGEGGLAAHLVDGCARLRLTHATVAIDCALNGIARACLLTRGILLPLADDDGALGFAYCVLNWMQVLDREASDRLRREFGAALANTPAGLSSFPRPGRQY